MTLIHLWLPALPETWLSAHPVYVLVTTFSLPNLWLCQAPACLQASASLCCHIGELLSAFHIFPFPFPVLSIAKSCCALGAVGWQPLRVLSKSMKTRMVAQCVTDEFFCICVPSGSDQGPSITWRNLRDLQELELGAFPSDLLPLGFLLWLRFECCPRADWGQVVPQPTNGHVNPIMAFPTDFCSPAPSPSQFLWQLLPPAESSLQG